MTTWLGAHEEWRAAEGIWELNDPVVPTNATGFPKDKLLFRRGHTIPSNLPAWRDGESACEDRPVLNPNPAEVIAGELISDHSPLQLVLPCEPPGRPRKMKKLRLKDLSEALRNSLEQAQPRFDQLYSSRDVYHF